MIDSFRVEKIDNGVVVNYCERKLSQGSDFNYDYVDTKKAFTKENMAELPGYIAELVAKMHGEKIKEALKEELAEVKEEGKTGY